LLVNSELSAELSNDNYLKVLEDTIGCKIWPGFKSETRKELPDDINAIRAIQYQSARGLEGWTVFALNFDRYFNELKNHLHIEYNLLENKALSLDEWVHIEISRWLLMIFTRAIDTIFIHIEDKNSEVFKLLESFANNYPDYISLDG
jgi:hypothetical protein